MPLSGRLVRFGGKNVFQVRDGVLRHVSSPAEAARIAGPDWRVGVHDFGRTPRGYRLGPNRDNVFVEVNGRLLYVPDQQVAQAALGTNWRNVVTRVPRVDLVRRPGDTNVFAKVGNRFLHVASPRVALRATASRNWRARVQITSETLPGLTRIPRSERQDALTFLHGVLDDLGFSRADRRALSDWAWKLIEDGAPPERVLVELPERPEFRRRFPAIHRLRERDLQPPSVDEYVRFERDVQSVVQRFGLPPEFYSPSRITNLLLNQVSASELNQRLNDLSADVLARGPAIRQWYQENYNISNLSDGAILASAFSPNISPHIFEQRIRAAQIGGTAAQFGFERGRGRAQTLAQFGLTMEQAQEVFRRATDVIPTVRNLLRRHFDPSTAFGIQHFEDAMIFGDPEQQRRMQRIFQREAAQFTPGATFLTGQEGEMTGLRQR